MQLKFNRLTVHGLRAITGVVDGIGSHIIGVTQDKVCQLGNVRTGRADRTVRCTVIIHSQIFLVAPADAVLCRRRNAQCHNSGVDRGSARGFLIDRVDVHGRFVCDIDGECLGAALIAI